MLLDQLKRSKWYNKKSKRLWRGNASGKWNYSTRWLKWQNARSGGGMPAWFEGWQTPLTQRIPKLRWFKRYYKLVKVYTPINLDILEKNDRVKSGDLINKAKLKELNLIKNEKELVKILAKWDLTKKLIFEWIDAFSSAAKSKIEKAWWEIK